MASGLLDLSLRERAIRKSSTRQHIDIANLNTPPPPFRSFCHCRFVPPVDITIYESRDSFPIFRFILTIRINLILHSSSITTIDRDFPRSSTAVPAVDRFGRSSDELIREAYRCAGSFYQGIRNVIKSIVFQW